jgi:hypothetical protein
MATPASDGAGQLVLVTGATGKVGAVFLAAYQRARPAGARPSPWAVESIIHTPLR